MYIRPVKLALSEDPGDSVGSIRLRRYQAEVRRSCSRYVLVSAPTGSGKTLGYLVRAFRPVGGEPFKTVVMVYPTNALIWDQARAIEGLLVDHFGFKVSVVGEESLGGASGGVGGVGDVLLLVANGESLLALSKGRGRSEGRVLLEILRRDYRTRIVLTNPDILYYMFLYRFAASEELFSALFKENIPNLLVLDEVHLYYGYSLAMLTYMFGYMRDLFDQVIFGSATPINVGAIVGDGVDRIEAQPSVGGQVVRFGCTLTIDGFPGFGSKEYFDKLVGKVCEYYEKHKDDKQRVKVLVILNSVLGCYALQERLEKEFPGEVTGIHGLVPPQARPHNQSEFKPIVVGTSAVEVGVDFDTASLIFEAGDSSSFIQRFGRGARHSECEAYAFIPQLYVEPLMKGLAGRSELEYSEFVGILTSRLRAYESYVEFPFSEQAAPLLHAVYLNWALQRPAGGGHGGSKGRAAQELKQLLEMGRFYVPGHLSTVYSFIKKMIDSPDPCTFRLVDMISFRNTLGSLPALFTKYDPPLFDYVSLGELPKLVFSVKPREEIEKRYRIPLKMRLEERFLVVEDINNNPPKIRLFVKTSDYRDAPRLLYGGVKCEPPNEGVRTGILSIIEKQPAVVFNKHDWRLAGLWTMTGEFLVVGGDAYVAWFLNGNPNYI
ncbi:MAG: DEAD/DEAH box helicase [Thermoprotei archaeon]